MRRISEDWALRKGSCATALHSIGHCRRYHRARPDRIRHLECDPEHRQERWGRARPFAPAARGARRHPPIVSSCIATLTWCSARRLCKRASNQAHTYNCFDIERIRRAGRQSSNGLGRDHAARWPATRRPLRSQCKINSRGHSLPRYPACMWFGCVPTVGHSRGNWFAGKQTLTAVAVVGGDRPGSKGGDPLQELLCCLLHSEKGAGKLWEHLAAIGFDTNHLRDCLKRLCSRSEAAMEQRRAGESAQRQC